MKTKLLILMMVILSGNILFGQVGYNEEFRVDSEINGGNCIKMCRLTNGNIVSVWDGIEMFIQIFDSDLNKVGSITKLYRDAHTNQYEHNLTALSNSRWAMCWRHSSQNNHGIYFQIFDSNGVALSDQILVVSDDYPDKQNTVPNITVLKNGNIVVAWEYFKRYNGKHSYQIRARMFDESGERLSGIIIIKEEISYGTNSNFPVLEPISDEKFIICWADHKDKQIYGQFYNKDFAKIGSLIWIGGGTLQIPKLTVLPNGSFIVSWFDTGDIYVQKFNSKGEKLNSKIILERNYGSYYDVTTVGNKFIICYEERDGSRSGIFLQIFNEDFSEFKSEIQVNDNEKNDQLGPYVIDINQNKFVIAWESRDDGGGSVEGLYAKYYYSKPQNHELVDAKLITPAYDTTLTTITPYFEWNQAIEDRVNFPWEVYYDLYISKDENFSDPFVVYSITDTSYNLKEELDQQQLYYWKVLVNTYYGDSLWSSQANGFYISGDAVTDIENKEITPKEFSLHQNYPNPFNPSTMINYQIAMISDVKLEVYNNLGKKVATLVDENQQVGNYSVNFDATGLSSGIYFYRLVVGNPSTGSGQGYVETKKMVFIK